MSKARSRQACKADFERVFGYFPRLRERYKQQAGTLSGGEQQMLAISRALLLLKPKPAAARRAVVRPRAAGGGRDLSASCARSTKRDGVSILIVEQNANRSRSIWPTRAYLLETGRVVVGGAARRRHPRRRFRAPRLSRLLRGRLGRIPAPTEPPVSRWAASTPSTALALVMIFQATQLVNFAQGEMAMFSTYHRLGA